MTEFRINFTFELNSVNSEFSYIGSWNWNYQLKI